ncbi:MAG: ATP-dependent RecD-like DNA helicase, partial [Pseudomonadota bacterium]
MAMNLQDKNSKTSTDEDDQRLLTGEIDRITYFNEETGYTVAKLVVKDRQEPVTVVGSFISPRAGEVLELKGLWVRHPKFGRQFKVLEHRTRNPVTAEGIRKYLESGLVKGIGPVMAARIVKEFAERTLDVIENRVEDLHKIEGVGEKRIEMIRKAWKEQREIRDVMVFLHQHDVSTGYATKIFKRYGLGAISQVTENPYSLATDIQGIGFATADKIAQKLGFDKEAPVRAVAGILYVLHQLVDEGHVYYPYEPLAGKCREILGVAQEVIEMAVGPLTDQGRIVIEEINPDPGTSRAPYRAVYLKEFHVSEKGVETHMARLISHPKGIRKLSGEDAVKWVQSKTGLDFAPKQIEAVKRAISEKVMVITGGPGTGKTTIINAVIKIFQAAGATVQLAAPTGRASKRMSEATGCPAKTIHRLLAYSPHKGGFQRNENHPLDTNVLILDEVSMIDIVLMYHLLKALPSNATLVLVGDVNQLPSVGAGNVLKDIIQSAVVPVVELKEIFRQARQSLIVVNAHRIHQGKIPELSSTGKEHADFYFIEQEDPDHVLSIIQELVCSRIPAKFRLDPFEEIQVLSPMHKGAVGTENLNQKLQGVLNPSGTEINRGERVFRIKDKVMQVRNNYEKEVFNGDIGQIASIDPEIREVIVNYDGNAVTYEASELEEITLAYAISVHKSQGSEYPAVVLPLLVQHYLLLQRNLIYTAVTRGKKLVVMVGGKKALAMGVTNDRIRKRYTF